MEKLYKHAEDISVKVDADHPGMFDDDTGERYTQNHWVSIKDPARTRYIKTGFDSENNNHFITKEVFSSGKFTSIRTADAKDGAGLVSKPLTVKNKSRKAMGVPLGYIPNKIHSESYDPMSEYIW